MLTSMLAPLPSALAWGVGGVYGKACGLTPCACTHVLVAAAGLWSNGWSITVPNEPVLRTAFTPDWTASLSIGWKFLSPFGFSCRVWNVAVVLPTWIWLSVP